MTNQQYISIAKLLEQSNPELFEQYKSQISMEIDVELLFINFCVVQELKVSQVVERPYNREASKLKALFVGVLLITIKKSKLPRGYKKELAETLGVPQQRICYFEQNVTLFLKIYPDFQTEVTEICAKIQRYEFSTKSNKQFAPVQR